MSSLSDKKLTLHPWAITKPQAGNYYLEHIKSNPMEAQEFMDGSIYNSWNKKLIIAQHILLKIIAA